jgi:hypothetical protein
MTAERRENDAARQAQAAGEAAAAAHAGYAEQMQLNIAGSQVAVEAAATPDDIAADWPR